LILGHPGSLHLTLKTDATRPAAINVLDGYVTRLSMTIA
jgi:hypothetical protein